MYMIYTGSKTFYCNEKTNDNIAYILGSGWHSGGTDTYG